MAGAIGPAQIFKIMIKTISASEEVEPISKALMTQQTLQPPSLILPSLPSSPPQVHSSKQKDFEVENDKHGELYEILDKVSESNEEEIKRIKHTPKIDKNSGKAKYNCDLCHRMSNFFTEAEQHHLEHEESEFSHVRETLRRVEFERLTSAKECRHNLLTKESLVGFL